ncbi:hypothetical protein I3271_07530 [Photobacterium leiognathi]|uniref:hypothetical protein n=1 Tax=Photobacterium leiognathi TaxID=553611 RepID=UPI001EDE7B5B|nr:hypothetical protein [Photobacterium leiognathi]MCG3884537.1 hypothetical protein [Photobacterium leiognathi]
MRINNYCINHLKMMIPEENKERIDLLNKFDASCKDWIQVLKVGADENHPSNQHVIELVNKLVSEKDFQQFDVCELIFNTSEKELTNKGFKVSESAENNNFLKAAEMVEYLYKIEGDQLNKTAENHFDNLDMFAKNLANLKTKLNIK